MGRMTSKADTVDVTAILDRRLSSYQYSILAICFALAFVDGIDSLAPSITIPAIARELGLARSQIGIILSASPWGALFGALIFGPVADRIGRRPIVIGCALLFSAGTLATTWANSFESILALRLITGFGIGGTLPCLLTLPAEYTPTRIRAGVVAIIASAVPMAGILIGASGVVLMGQVGWRGVYFIIGVLSLLVCLLVILRLPESVAFLILRRRPAEAIRQILNRIAPGEIDVAATRFSIAEPTEAGSQIRHLFTDGRLPLTVLLWLSLLLISTVLLGSLVWTPTLLRQAGLSEASASFAFLMNNIGGILGGMLAGQFVDRLQMRSFFVLALASAFGGIALMMVGVTADNATSAAIFSAVTGLFVAMVTGGLGVLALSIYPAFMRTTGVGWSNGFVRLGSSIGPAIGGIMFAAGLTVQTNFGLLGAIAIADVFVIAAAGFVAVRRFPTLRQTHLA